MARYSKLNTAKINEKMKLLFLILLSSTLHAQQFDTLPIHKPNVYYKLVDPIIEVKVDTITFGDSKIYVFPNGSAWVVSPGSVEFMGKRNYRRWKRNKKAF